jgi:phosphonate transport system permease protein
MAVCYAAAMAFAAYQCELTPETFQRGFGKANEFLRGFWPPLWESTGEIVEATLKTLLMAGAATLLSLLASLPLALAASRNVAPRWLYAGTRFLLGVYRALPEILTLLFFVAAYGLGPFPGIVALTLGSSATLAKLLADSIEETDRNVGEALAAAGASRWQVVRWAILPQVLPSIAMNALFRFDVNVRSTVILGAVGAGGIGYEIQKSMGELRYDRATVAVIGSLIVVLSAERLAGWLRRSMMPAAGAASAAIPSAVRLPAAKARRIWVGAGAVVAAVVGLTAALGVNPLDFLFEFHYVANLAADSFPPNVSLLLQPRIWSSVGESIAMAGFGAGVGVALALVCGFLAAENTTPHPLIRWLVRLLMALERALTSFFLLLVLLVAFGLGPVAAALTLLLATVGVFGKLFADAIERVSPGPAEALEAAGASRWQVVLYAIWPEVLPSLLANSLLAMDAAIRTAIALGIFGAGGLGFEVMVANQMLRYRDVLGFTLLAILVVTFFERISNALRARLLEPARA